MLAKSIAVLGKKLYWFFITSQCGFTIFLIVFSIVFLTNPAPAQTEADSTETNVEPVAARRLLHAGILPADFKPGAMAEMLANKKNGLSGWVTADSIDDLVTWEPEEGGTPDGKTIVKVLANQNDIVIAARCYDNQPQNIVSYSKARDTELDEEDHISIVLDTFLDGRSGYVFAVNPSGARFDGLVIEQGGDVNSDWDAIWEAYTFQDDLGWYAEIRLPIQSLNFKKGLTEWGFNVQRRVQRLQETSRWANASRDNELEQTNLAGLLADIPAFNLGMGLSIRPALSGRTRKLDPEEDREWLSDMSLDITQKLGPNLLSALTVNTDFAETEVDVRQINLTRFPVYFPEKRSFFLEGADIFEFGLGLDEDNLQPFFSRRIGLLGASEHEQTQVPILVGGKINGRIGNTNLGALVVGTEKVKNFQLGEEETLNVPNATMGTLRVSQNVLEESSVGVLANFGDQQGRSGSWTAGADFNYRTSEFLGDKTFLVGFWGLLNDREELEGDKSAYGLRIEYPNDLFDITATSIHIGDAFDPSLGFVPRKDVHLWDFTVEYAPRPGWALVRQMVHEMTFQVYNNRANNKWESYTIGINPIGWIMESGDLFEAGLELQGDRPPEEFEIADEISISPGSYEWTSYYVGLATAQKRMVNLEGRFQTGDYYNGTLNTLEAVLAVRPSSFFTLELIGERNTGTAMVLDEDTGELSEEDYTEEFVGARVLLNFSSNLQFSSLTQYETESREIGSNNKLRWTFHPFGDIFIVYNHNLIKSFGDNRWKFVSNELPIKVQYAFRF